MQRFVRGHRKQIGSEFGALCQTSPKERQTRHEARTMNPEVTITSIDHASLSTVGAFRRTDLFEIALPRKGMVQKMLFIGKAPKGKIHTPDNFETSKYQNLPI